MAPQNRELHRDLLAIKEEIHNPSDPLPDSMFKEGGTTPHLLKTKEGLLLKDRDSGGSTSSGVGSSL